MEDMRHYAIKRYEGSILKPTDRVWRTKDFEWENGSANDYKMYRKAVRELERMRERMGGGVRWHNEVCVLTEDKVTYLVTLENA